MRYPLSGRQSLRRLSAAVRLLPRACHGDLLMWLSNATRDQRVARWRGLMNHSR